MDFDKIIEEWKQDCPIDDTTLDKESVKIPTLHGKYLELHSREKIFLNYLEVEYKKRYRERWEYYSGKAEKPFQLKLLKTDLHIYLDSDDKLCELKEKIDTQKQKVSYVESVIKSLETRSFHITNAINWRKFTAGHD
tara:strand:+ start:1128 stop:1538 length:411 start_codon:yes stop_codon:yes gene_type:complete